jgi:hypothetical protein
VSLATDLVLAELDGMIARGEHNNIGLTATEYDTIRLFHEELPDPEVELYYQFL